jgi:hypothetical protein
MQNETWSNLINAQHQQSIKRQKKEKQKGGNNKRNSHLQRFEAARERGEAHNKQHKHKSEREELPWYATQLTSRDWVKIYSRQSSPPPSLHQLKCSGSQDSFTVDPYCNSGGINSGGQWPIPNCGGQMCHHGPGPGGSMPMTMSHLPMLAHGPSMSSLHGPLPPPPLCNPCSSQPNNFNSVPLPGPSRWGPRTSCPVHSPFRARIPNGTICSGHQVMKLLHFFPVHCTILTVSRPLSRTTSNAADNEPYRFPFWVEFTHDWLLKWLRWRLLLYIVVSCLWESEAMLM